MPLRTVFTLELIALRGGPEWFTEVTYQLCNTCCELWLSGIGLFRQRSEPTPMDIKIYRITPREDFLWCQLSAAFSTMNYYLNLIQWALELEAQWIGLSPWTSQQSWGSSLSYMNHSKIAQWPNQRRKTAIFPEDRWKKINPSIQYTHDSKVDQALCAILDLKSRSVEITVLSICRS